MKEKSIEDIAQEINARIQEIHSPEEQKSTKELLATIIDIMTLNPEQLNKIKENLKKDDSINVNLKKYFMELIDGRIQFLELESMSPSQRKAHDFMKLVNTENEQERENLENELDIRGMESKLKINNGPFGLLYYGKNENGDLGIGLRLSRRTSSDQVVYIPQEELESFFEKSNMEVLSMFNEEIDSRRLSEPELKTLYLIDCLREKGVKFEEEFYDITNSDIQISLEDGQYLKLDSGYILEMGKEGEEPDCVEFKYGENPGIVSEETLVEGTDSQLHSIFVEAKENFPEIIKQVKDGEYHSKLAKREKELSELEKESEKYSKMEALQDKLEEKEGQDIGEN